MIPVLLLCGPAGSGKDSVGLHIAKHYNGACIGQADPMKLMARDFFGFDDKQLFGPSECRNELDVEAGQISSLDQGHVEKWCREIFPNNTKAAVQALNLWFDVTILGECDKKGGLSPRFALQTLGTEWGRRLDVEVWTKYAIRTAVKLLGGGFSYTKENGIVENADAAYNISIITDGRFRSEILLAKACGGVACLIQRDAAKGGAAAQAAGVVGHKSETELSGIPQHFYDYVLTNNGTFAQLDSKAEFLAQTICSGSRKI